MKPVEEMPSLSEVQAELAYKSLFHFFRLSWPQLEQTQTLILNWHLEAICDHVQATLEDWIAHKKWEIAREKASQNGTKFLKPEPVQRIRDAIYNIPPGSSKSRIVSVCTPAWMWLHWPSWRSMFLSANPRVALRDSMLCRDLIQSEWYRRSFYPDWQLRDDQRAKSLYWTTKGGFRIAGGWFSKVIGERVDGLFMDDPNDPEEAKSDQMCETVNSRYDSGIANRVSDARTSTRNLIQQRLSVKDLTGHLLEKGGWHLLSIPMEYEPSRIKDDPDYAKNEIPRVTAIGFSDPREAVGELLDKERFPPEEVAKAKDDLGPFGYAGQMQQRPAPLEGGIWKRRWLGYWVPEGIALPPVIELLSDGSFHTCDQKVLPARFDFKLQSWDMAFGKSETSSMVVGQIWALAKIDRFLLDQVRDQLDFNETQTAFRTLSGNWPEVETKLVENKANGPAIISSLKGEFSGILAVEPEGDKVARALAEQGTFESGHVFLPHPKLFDPKVALQLEASHPQIAAMIRRALADVARRANSRSKAKPQIWVSLAVEEFANFPAGAFKDIVDTSSQALNRIRKYIKIRDAQNQSSGQTSTSYRSLR